MLTVLCKSMLLRMRLTMGVRRVLRCERLAMDYVGGFYELASTTKILPRNP